MRRLRIHWMLIALGVCAGHGYAAASDEERVLGQVFTVEPWRYLSKFDAARKTLFLYRQGTERTNPMVRSYTSDGTPKVDYYPLRDFSEAASIDVWDLAATPDDGLLLAAVLHLKEGVAHRFLWYDSQGRLKRTWNMYPYHHHRLAVDPSGNVYALGHRMDAGQRAEHAVLVKYSQDGEVLAGLLSSSVFAAGDAVGAFSDTLLLLPNDKLVLFVGETNELFWFDVTQGRISRRVSLAGELDRWTAQLKATRPKVFGVAADDDGLVAQIAVDRREPALKRRGVMVRVANDGSFSPYSGTRGPLAEAPGPFLGVDRDSSLIFLLPRPEGPVLVRH